MELDKYLEQGDKLIESLNERLEKQVAKDEQKLLDKVVGESVDKLNIRCPRLQRLLILDGLLELLLTTSVSLLAYLVCLYLLSRSGPTP